MSTVDDEPAPSSDRSPASPAGGPPVKRVVFIGSAAGTLAVTAWALISPTGAEAVLGWLVGWVSGWFGWYYITLATAILIFVIGIGISRYGNVSDQRG